MTVSELIEALRSLSGDPDLRTVKLLVTVYRLHGSNDIVIEGGAWGVGIRRDVAVIEGCINLE